jgi:hypothetical protein
MKLHKNFVFKQVISFKNVIGSCTHKMHDVKIKLHGTVALGGGLTNALVYWVMISARRGSVIDTAKAVNLYAIFPPLENDMDFKPILILI